MELPVVNHKDYVAQIGDDHKFPINKFGELAKYLINQKVVKKFHNPTACSFETLNRAHSENYSIFYTQMIEDLEACVNGKPIRVIEK